MSPPFDTLVVTGHTLTFEVRVPPHDHFRAVAPHEFVYRTRLGAGLVSRLVAAAGVGPATVLCPAAKPLPFPAKDGRPSRSVVWRMGWHPADKAPESLRIEGAADVTFGTPDDGFEPVRLSEFPAGRVTKGGKVKADATTAVYLYLDVCSSYWDTVEWYVPAAAGFVLVHLSNTDAVTDDDRERLQKFLAGVTDPVPANPNRRTVLLVGDRVLHALGFPITEDRSWEAFADDCVRELVERPAPGAAVEALRKAFARFEHLVVRHNPYAALHLHTPFAVRGASGGNHLPRAATLHYLVTPERKYSAHTAYVRGINDILGASIAAAVVRGEGIAGGIAAGLHRCSWFDERGYFHKKAGFARNRLHAVVRKPIPDAGTSDRWVTAVGVPAADADLRPAKWSILDLHLRPERWASARSQAAGDKDKSLGRALRLGLDIVRFGLAEVQKRGLRCPDTGAEQSAGERRRLPAVTFQKLKVVDRLAFEDVFEIRGAMLGYLNNFRKETSPLCLAMFGAPGGGKSFAVKQLAESLGHPALELPPLEVNVAQYEKAEDLAWVFNKVRTATQGGKVPLVFFDEFDTTRDDRPFGWQQTFLAPMQDGRFGRPPDVIDYKHGIFVFVGGVNHSFDGITGRSRNRVFIEAKGPDFVSRLVRHLNVLGITQDDADADDFTFVIRRAVLLRDHLYRFQQKLFRDGEKGRAEVDDDVVAALLTVPRFRHGVRSLEAIVRTSRLHPDRPRLHWGALPPDSQLDMHVDIAELQRARREYPSLIA